MNSGFWPGKLLHVDQHVTVKSLHLSREYMKLIACNMNE